MTLTVGHINTIIAAIDAGWSPAEIIADMNSGLDHFGLASINGTDVEARPLLPVLRSSPTGAVTVAIQQSKVGFYNALGMFEPDSESELTAAAMVL